MLKIMNFVSSGLDGRRKCGGGGGGGGSGWQLSRWPLRLGIICHCLAAFLDGHSFYAAEEGVRLYALRGDGAGAGPGEGEEGKEG